MLMLSLFFSSFLYAQKMGYVDYDSLVSKYTKKMLDTYPVSKAMNAKFEEIKTIRTNFLLEQYRYLAKLYAGGCCSPEQSEIMLNSLKLQEVELKKDLHFCDSLITDYALAMEEQIRSIVITKIRKKGEEQSYALIFNKSKLIYENSVVEDLTTVINIELDRYTSTILTMANLPDNNLEQLKTMSQKNYRHSDN